MFLSCMKPSPSAISTTTSRFLNRSFNAKITNTIRCLATTNTTVYSYAGRNSCLSPIIFLHCNSNSFIGNNLQTSYFSSTTKSTTGTTMSNPTTPNISPATLPTNTTSTNPSTALIDLLQQVRKNSTDKSNMTDEEVAIVNKLTKTNLLLEEIQNLKSIKSKLIKEDFKEKKDDNINYIINITLTKKDTRLFITDIKGNLRLFKSANTITPGVKTRAKQPTQLLKVLKYFIQYNINIVKNKSVAIHFTNMNKRYINMIISILENLVFIKIIKIYNFLIPHNGCRPKKVKRKKKRKIRFY